MRNIANIFSVLKTAYINRSDPEGMQLLARTYWRVVLALSILVAVISFGIGGYQLWDVLGTFTPRQTSQALLPITVDRKKLQKTIDGYDTRRKFYESLPNATSTYPDPSR